MLVWGGLFDDMIEWLPGVCCLLLFVFMAKVWFVVGCMLVVVFDLLLVDW